jgi:hypothetical protein
MSDENNSHKGVFQVKDESKDPQHIESQELVHTRKSVAFRMCCPVFIVALSLIDIIWQCYVQYVQLYPLSTFARVIRGTPQRWWLFVISENFFMVLVVGCNTLLGWSMLEGKSLLSGNKSTAPDSTRSRLKKLFTYIRYLGFLVLLIALVTIPFWWRNFAWSAWRRALWRNAQCQDWDYLITMDTVDFREFMSNNSVVYSKASIRGTDGSNYMMHLEHPSSSLSTISVRGDNRRPTPYVVEYNFTDLRYSSPALSGEFTNFPGLSFPDLSIYPRFPNYTRDWECDAPGVALTDGNLEIVRTALGNYDDCTMLNVCGRGSFDRVIVPLGAILIEMEKSGLCCTSPFMYILSWWS